MDTSTMNQHNTEPADTPGAKLKHPIMKLLIPMLCVAGAVAIVRYGYLFGRWLHAMLN
ncbi:MAG: hypothetical protein JNL32_04320 [Candidatus Kapabacteria bacterium]|nr:hypothetical protein [Candidatus Kapabacteria bacterium]